MQIRIKTATGQKTFKDVHPDSPMSDLLQQCLPSTDGRSIDSIAIDSIKLFRGYPPEPLALFDVRQSFDSLGIQHGDTLTFEVPIVQSNRVPNVDQSSQSASSSSGQSAGPFCRQIVPADNSCLFTSINFCISGKVDPSCSNYMRQLIMGAVSTDPARYSEAILGRPNDDYCAWIMQDQSWGGAIEAQILAEYYGIVVTIVDTKTTFVTNFGEGRSFAQRIFLIYDGVHYDPLYEKAGRNSSSSQNVATLRDLSNTSHDVDAASIGRTIFPVDDTAAEDKAMSLVQSAQKDRQFTDVQNFKLKCLKCQKALKGQPEAQKHAKETGHTDFGEY